MSKKRQQKKQKQIDWAPLVRAVRGEMQRNAARIEAGETFASQARTGRKPSPSKTDRGTL